MSHGLTDAMDPLEARALVPRGVERTPGRTVPLHRHEVEHLEAARLRAAPLSVFARSWGGAVVIEGTGWWLSRRNTCLARPRWVRRHFVLAWSVLYMFDGDRPGDKCCGGVDIRRADLRKADSAGRVAIVITPVTQMRSSEWSTEEDARVTVYFSPERLIDVWLKALQRIAAAPRSSPAKAPDPFLPIAGDQQQEQEWEEKGECKKAIETHLSLKENGKPTLNIRSPRGRKGNRSVRVQEVEDDDDDDEALGEKTVKSSELRPSHTDDTSQSADPSAIIEAYRQQMQCLTINAETVKQRISRVVASKEPRRLADLLLRFVMNNVDNAAALWALMGEAEELPETDGRAQSGWTHPVDPFLASNFVNGEVQEQKGKVKKASPPDVTPIAVEESQVLSPEERGTSNSGRVRILGLDDSDAQDKDKGNEAETFSLMNDSVWRRRMQRVHARRSMVESILSDIPKL